MKEFSMKELLKEAMKNRAQRSRPDEEAVRSFAPGLKAITDMLYAAHPSNLDTEVYAYAELGEYCADHSRIVVHTVVIEEDVSPFRPKSAEYAWYGAGVLDAGSGEVVFLDGNIYYRGNMATNSEWHHDAVLDHTGSRILEYDVGLRVRKIGSSGDGDVKELGTGEFLFADFLEDDRYVVCEDADHCVKVIDTVTGWEIV